MALTLYSHTLGDTANGSVNLSTLGAEIVAKPEITVAYSHTNLVNDVLDVWFKNALPLDEQTALDQVLASHQGVLPDEVPSPVTLHGVAVDEDGKIPVVPFPATKGFLTWMTSQSDYDDQGDSTGRGEGVRMYHAVTNGDSDLEKTVLLRFKEVVQIHDGEIHWKTDGQWSLLDSFSVGVSIPETPVTATPGTGNANAVALGGGMLAYVPAIDNTGSHTIDLTTAAPVFIKEGHALTGVALWGVDWEGSGEVVAGSVDGERYALFNFTSPVGYLLKNIGLGSPRGLFEIDAYRVEYFHPTWSLLFTVTRNAAPTADTYVGGWLFGFRKEVTT